MELLVVGVTMTVTLLLESKLSSYRSTWPGYSTSLLGFHFDGIISMNPSPAYGRKSVFVFGLPNTLAAFDMNSSSKYPQQRRQAWERLQGKTYQLRRRPRRPGRPWRRGPRHRGAPSAPCDVTRRRCSRRRRPASEPCRRSGWACWSAQGAWIGSRWWSWVRGGGGSMQLRPSLPLFHTHTHSILLLSSHQSCFNVNFGVSERRRRSSAYRVCVAVDQGRMRSWDWIGWLKLWLGHIGWSSSSSLPPVFFMFVCMTMIACLCVPSYMYLDP